MYEDCLNSSYLYLRIDNSTRLTNRYLFVLKYRKYLYTYKDITIHIIFEDDQVISHHVGGKCLVYVYMGLLWATSHSMHAAAKVLFSHMYRVTRTVHLFLQSRVNVNCYYRMFSFLVLCNLFGWQYILKWQAQLWIFSYYYFNCICHFVFPLEYHCWVTANNFFSDVTITMILR